MACLKIMVFLIPDYNKFLVHVQRLCSNFNWQLRCVAQLPRKTSNRRCRLHPSIWVSIQILPDIFYRSNQNNSIKHFIVFEVYTNKDERLELSSLCNCASIVQTVCDYATCDLHKQRQHIPKNISIALLQYKMVVLYQAYKLSKAFTQHDDNDLSQAPGAIIACCI